jgi:hypothetical protein
MSSRLPVTFVRGSEKVIEGSLAILLSSAASERLHVDAIRLG